ncbi:flagellar hook-basal body complex protein FliE [Domibacillus epiphyticus]|uniref:Flagellar hook-basal body complex protein FliE n=1 Tax=Domibacillus epiphyticus TaxID=1714355 RepID=A0A1V2AC99_9BACI|nr:flagellar hook-basal body complex protein FliE [Domibacillus epiphyticus]OMP68597.1 flagellar hook-basal body complex protein FliE [Domibacillus epiphyticus]
MAIEALNAVSSNVIQTGDVKKVSTPYEAQQKFADFLKDSLNNVMKNEEHSNSLQAKMIRGEDVDIHQVMAAAQKSGITMQLTIEMRNKAVEAYQEIMRMQI